MQPEVPNLIIMALIKDLATIDSSSRCTLNMRKKLMIGSCVHIAAAGSMKSLAKDTSLSAKRNTSNSKCRSDPSNKKIEDTKDADFFLRRF